MMNYEQERKYIHNLANTISIIDASVSRTLTLLTRGHPELNEEIVRLRKADEYIKKTIHSLRGFREHIHSQIQQENQATKSPEH